MSVFPLTYIKEVRDVIWDELNGRLSPDIFQGILLEIVQLISKDLQDIFLGDTQNLILGFRHYTYLIAEFLKTDET